MAEDGSEEAGAIAKPWSGGGREELTAAVRRLMTVNITSLGSQDVLLDAAARISELADELEHFVPVAGAVPLARFADLDVRTEESVSLTSWMPFDMIVGACNPVAPPMSIEFDPPKAIGKVTFSPVYEGAPGCVHGAALAGVFDLMLAAANTVANAAGPTAELTIRYRKPTLISQPSVLEAWVTKKVGRRIYSEGRLMQGDVITVEAVGEFVDVGRDRIAAMHRRDEVRSRDTEAAD